LFDGIFQRFSPNPAEINGKRGESPINFTFGFQFVVPLLSTNFYPLFNPCG
jgi:hypothetical protein